MKEKWNVKKKWKKIRKIKIQPKGREQRVNKEKKTKENWYEKKKKTSRGLNKTKQKKTL